LTIRADIFIDAVCLRLKDADTPAVEPVLALVTTNIKPATKVNNRLKLGLDKVPKKN